MNNLPTLAGIAGLILSLSFSYIPGLKDWYDNKLTSIQRRGVMAAMLVLTAVGLYLAACNGIIAGYPCDWKVMAEALIAALVTNQATYAMSPASSDNG